MPIPVFTKLGPQPEFTDVVNKVNTLVQELQNLMLGVDSVNIFEVGGWRVTLDQLASADGDVGFSTEDTAGDDIRIWAGDALTGTPSFIVRKSGKMQATDGEFTGTITGSTITGGTLRTAASGARIELSNNSLKTYNSSNQFQGFAWGTDVSGSTYGDAFLYHGNTKLVQFFDEITNYVISGTSSATGFALGSPSCPTTGRGTWEFSSSGSVDAKGTFKVHTGTSFDTISQSNSTAATVADLVTDFNTLLSNLRSMNILA